MVREDSRKLKDMFVINSLTKRPTLEKYRYEMPGEKDLCQYELWIINIEKKQPTGFRLINGRISIFRLSNPEKKVTSFFSSVLSVHGMKLIFAW